MLKEENSIPTVRALERGLLIIDTFIQEKKPLSIAELDRLLNLPRSTVWRLIKTLEKQGYLVKISESEKYWMSSKILQIYSAFIQQSELYVLATPILLELRNLTRETIHLNIRENYERVCTYCLEGLELIKSANQTGQRSPLHLGASAKVLLAGMDDNYVLEYIKYSSIDPITASALLEQIKVIRQQDYFITKEERIPDMIAVAVPIKDLSYNTIATLALTAPLSRSKIVTEKYLGLVIKAAKDISTQLGYK